MIAPRSTQKMRLVTLFIISRNVGSSLSVSILRPFGFIVIVAATIVAAIVVVVVVVVVVWCSDCGGVTLFSILS